MSYFFGEVFRAQDSIYSVANLFYSISGYEFRNSINDIKKPQLNMIRTCVPQMRSFFRNKWRYGGIPDPAAEMT